VLFAEQDEDGRGDNTYDGGHTVRVRLANGQLYEVGVRAEYSPDYYAHTCDEVEDEEQATEDGLPPTEEG